MAWYETVRRWCQTNLTEIDGQVCDVAFWKQFWQENRIGGIIVNAGGIVAYYPSDDALQYRSPYLGQRDLLGEFTHAAREMGLAVIARMDCNRANEAMYRAHPDWFSVDAYGQPYQVNGRYIACVNGDYDKRYIPERLREIIRRYAPDGFADNSWQGLAATQICYCQSCRSKFEKDCGLPLPKAVDWADGVYRRWVKWSIDCRMENWHLFNQTTQENNPDCLWLGMVNADPVNAHCAMYDLEQIGSATPFLMVDHQNRDGINGFEQNLCNGLLLHGLCGPDGLMAESMARYSRGVYTFRRCAMPPKEVALWMLCGMAGGISPWLHVVGAEQEDKRQLSMDKEIMAWHEKHQSVLEHRMPVATVGLVWSQRSITFYGQDCSRVRCALPWRGFVRALTRGRIPYVPVCASHIPTDTLQLRTLILPDVAVMSDVELQRLEAFQQAGGHVLATGASGMLNEWGDVRTDHWMDKLLGVCRSRMPLEESYQGDWDHYPLHNYMRIEQPQHPVFASFQSTSILPFGGWLQPVDEVAQGRQVVATYVPPFPYYPPEFAYMREEKTDTPLLVTGETPSGGKVAFLAADIDRRYGEAGHPDHGDLLAALVCWLADDHMPIHVEGSGYLAIALYRQKQRLILHMVNLSGANVIGGFAEETYPIDDLCIRIPAMPDLDIQQAQLLVRGTQLPVQRQRQEWVLRPGRLNEHECIVLE